MIITRELINKNIKFHEILLSRTNEFVLKTYSYTDLCVLIDTYKNLLISKGGRKGYSAVIGEQISLSQTAFVFACAELGIDITIVDNPHGPTSQEGYFSGMISTKLKLLLPITYLLSSTNDYTVNNDKTRILMDVCRYTVFCQEEPKNQTPNDVIYAQDDTIFLRCTSSGTTGTPKVITHTHDFMSRLIKRNSSMFQGTMGVIANLNHGSSPATFFLPGIVSENVTDIYHIQAAVGQRLAIVLSKLQNLGININHIMFPYTYIIDDFFATGQKADQCIFYTLSVIKNEWLKFVKQDVVKDIISIFGTNETSGTLMINQATDDDFTENTYKALDDFYGLIINGKSELEVQMPVYDKVVATNDAFTKIKDKYLHLGRSNLYRINDLEIDVNNYSSLLKKHGNADIIVDTNKNSIYIVFWDNSMDASIAKDIDQLMREDSNGLHFISKHAYLDQKDFLTGVKVDRQLIREYFRNMVNQKTLR